MLTEVTSRRFLTATLLLALAFTSVAQTGCTRPIRRLGIIDELAIGYRDAVWAKRAYNLRYANCNREYEDHFKNGFCAGYADVSNGGDGYLPALPPDEYRGFQYQCAEGSNCVDSWFKGYPAGVAAAREEKAGDYNEIQISSMLNRAVTQADAPNILPNDVPVTKPSSTLLRPDNRILPKRLGKSITAMTAMPRGPESRLAPRMSNTPAMSSMPNTSAMSSMPNTSLAAAANSVAKSVSVMTPSRPAVPPIVSGGQIKIDPSLKTSAVPTAPMARPATTLPPIVSGTNNSNMSREVATTVPPIVKGRKIDPVASVSANETPLPMSMSSSSRNSQTRTASWPVNRK